MLYPIELRARPVDFPEDSLKCGDTLDCAVGRELGGGLIVSARRLQHIDQVHDA